MRCLPTGRSFFSEFLVVWRMFRLVPWPWLAGGMTWAHPVVHVGRWHSSVAVMQVELSIFTVDNVLLVYCQYEPWLGIKFNCWKVGMWPMTCQAKRYHCRFDVSCNAVCEKCVRVRSSPWDVEESFEIGTAVTAGETFLRMKPRRLQI